MSCLRNSSSVYLRRGLACCRSAAAVVLAWGLFSAAASAQESLADQTAELGPWEVHTRQFLDDVAAGKVTEAYATFLEGSPLAKEQAAVNELLQRTEELAPRFGKCWGVERVRQVRLGRNVIVEVYLYQCERRPVVWYVTHYQSPASDATSLDRDTWRVISLRFDTDVERLALRGPQPPSE